MPRQPRKKSETGIYHVILRGVNRQVIFQDDEDRKTFLEILAHYKQISGYEIYSYCLMDNHSHILFKEGQEQLHKAVKRITGKYVLWYNKKYERCGHLFQERFKSEPVESDQYFLALLRYIHQNPQEANLPDRLGNYLWTSYTEYTKNSKFVNVDFVLAMFSEQRNRAVELFTDYINTPGEQKCLDYEDKIQLSDTEIIKYITDRGLTIQQLSKLGKREREWMIKELKSLKGTTIRQLARVTGFSKSMIDRV